MSCSMNRKLILLSLLSVDEPGLRKKLIAIGALPKEDNARSKDDDDEDENEGRPSRSIYQSNPATAALSDDDEMDDD